MHADLALGVKGLIAVAEKNGGAMRLGCSVIRLDGSEPQPAQTK
jgi:recombinational DNA repair protein RecT